MCGERTQNRHGDFCDPLSLAEQRSPIQKHESSSITELPQEEAVFLK